MFTSKVVRVDFKFGMSEAEKRLECDAAQAEIEKAGGCVVDVSPILKTETVVVGRKFIVEEELPDES